MRDIEVEAKYALTGTTTEWSERLVALGAHPGPPVRQSDEYFQHPARDFVATGEAFRIRTVGEWNALTYKGPLLDPLTKSREELEVAFAAGHEEALRMRTLLMSLGFVPGGTVQKTRTTFGLSHGGRELTVAVDEVDGLGLYLEIETIAPEHDWHPARDGLLALASELGLASSERRSYLELLAGSRGV